MVSCSELTKTTKYKLRNKSPSPKSATEDALSLKTPNAELEGVLNENKKTEALPFVLQAVCHPCTHLIRGFAALYHKPSKRTPCQPYP